MPPRSSRGDPGMRVVDSRPWRGGFVGSDSLASETSGTSIASERRWHRVQGRGARAGLDLLLTCETITEARDKNDMRLKAPGEL